MKKIVFLSSLALIVQFSFSQKEQSLLRTGFAPLVEQANPFELICFEVEDSLFLQAKNCAPNAVLNAYSNNQGGKFMRSFVTDKNGNAKQSFGNTKLPAFVLNESKEEHENKNKVAFLKEREFILKDMKCTKTDESLIITWNAASSDAEEIRYVILSSEDGVKYKEEFAQNCKERAFLESFIFETNCPKPYYKMAVKKGENRTRYESQPFSFSEKELVVYPNPASTIGKVYIANTVQNGTLRIVRQEGNLVYSTTLLSKENSLPINQLENGTYTIEVLYNDTQKQVGKFIVQH